MDGDNRVEARRKPNAESNWTLAIVMVFRVLLCLVGWRVKKCGVKNDDVCDVWRGKKTGSLMPRCQQFRRVHVDHVLEPSTKIHTTDRGS